MIVQFTVINSQVRDPNLLNWERQSWTTGRMIYWVGRLGIWRGRSDLRGYVLERVEVGEALRQHVLRQHVAQTRLLLRVDDDSGSGRCMIASQTEHSCRVVLFDKRNAALEPLHRAFGTAHHLQAQQCRGGRIRHRHRPHRLHNSGATDSTSQQRSTDVTNFRENFRANSVHRRRYSPQRWAPEKNVAMTFAGWRAWTSPWHDQSLARQFSCSVSPHLAKSPKVAGTNTPRASVKSSRRFAFKESHQKKNPKKKRTVTWESLKRRFPVPQRSWILWISPRERYFNNAVRVTAQRIPTQRSGHGRQSGKRINWKLITTNKYLINLVS